MEDENEGSYQETRLDHESAEADVPPTDEAPPTPEDNEDEDTVATKETSGSGQGSSAPFTRQQKFTFASAALATFTSTMAFSIISVFFPIVAASKGVSQTTIGLVFSAFSVSSTIGSPIWGKVIPIIGARFVFLAGTFIAGGCNVLFGFVIDMPDTTTFTAFAFAIRIVEGFGTSATWTSSAAISAYAFPNNVGTVVSLIEMTAGLSFAIGPAIGGWLYTAGGFRLPFFILGGLVLAIDAVNYFLMPQQGGKNEKTGSVLQVLSIPAILVTLSVVLVASLALSFIDPTLSLHLRQLDFSIIGTGLMFMSLGLSYAIFSVMWGAVADSKKATRIMIVLGAFGTGVFFLLLGPSPLLKITPIMNTKPLPIEDGAPPTLSIIHEGGVIPDQSEAPDTEVAPPTSSIQQNDSVLSPNDEETEKSPKFTWKQKITFLSVILATLADVTAFSLMMPFFPLEAEERGLSSITVGFIFSIFSFFTFVASPICGKILPAVGARFMFLSGAFISGGCCILFGVLEYIYSETTFTIFCFVLRAVSGIGVAMGETASNAILAYAFPDNVGFVTSVNEMAVGVGAMIGPGIGGLLYSAGGFKLPFMVLGGVDMVFVVVNYMLMPHHGSKNEKMGSMVQVLKIPAVWVTLISMLMSAIALGFLDPTLSPHLMKLDLTVDQVGLIFVGFAAMYGLSSVLWGYIADKTNATRILMVMGLYGGCIMFLLIGPSPYLNLPFTTPIILTSTLVGAFTLSMTSVPSFLDLLSSAKWYGIPNDLGLNSIISGLWGGIFSLGTMLGPIFGGVLKEGFGFDQATTLLAGSYIFIMLFMCLFGVWEYRCGKGRRVPSSTIASLQTNSLDEEHRPLLDDTKFDYRSKLLEILVLPFGGCVVGLITMPSFVDMFTSAEWYGIPSSLGITSVVTGIWTGAFSLGTIIGPLLGGYLTGHYGFGFATTVMAGLCFLVMISVCLFGVWEYQCGKGRRVPRKRLEQEVASTDEPDVKTPLLTRDV